MGVTFRGVNNLKKNNAGRERCEKQVRKYLQGSLGGWMFFNENNSHKRT